MPTDVLQSTDLKTLATEALERAMRAGATDAEAVCSEGDEFSALVRLGQVETLKESGSRAIGLRVFIGQRTASTSSSDLSPEGIAKLVEGAVMLAKITSEDPFAGLPETHEFGQLQGDLGLYFEDVNEQPPAERIEIARRCEAAAMAFDTRIQNSGGGDFDTATGHKVLVNSRGFVGEYRRSYCGFSAAPIAVDAAGKMQRNYWYSSSRTMRLLEDPEEIGREAARRTLRRMGARQVKTQRAPVVLSPEIARSIIGNIFEAANGDAIYRHATFFDGMLGERVAGENVTVVDDGTVVRNGIGGFGTTPFDGEGLPTRRTVLVENGILKSYVLNSYTARKLGLKSTGNASRGLAGNPGIGAHNFYLEPGTLTPEAIIGDVKQGLYVTETMGFGVNLVTGDYSQGASGIWIENGELTYPVEEITIAGNLKDMYKNISAIGNDLVFRSAAAAPTLRIDGMMIAGA
ncbi:microcin-processing peptidase 1. Unknown type peptidase. MEROPS family U62 [Granulicella rosea]|uniref:PmbA protein n=1 Tax=Granulicella rosea TaxID=474952 RepID=A0A239JVE3_9BACT|nr:TldD/PmbA family protein [Granulicella rosea]SNT09831.1 microcin-processing peptidase 1. Unknown type peptidase. MEROPS family U62 [Granulicella rosea]